MKRKPIYIQKVGRIERPIPLLTHEQLVDWLIYHVPMSDELSIGGFGVSYGPQDILNNDHIFVTAPTPWEAYEKAAESVISKSRVHQEITDLYWYWTI